MAHEEGELVGRESQPADLTAELDALDTGPARVVEVVGEPGTGKTRLLAELSSLAAARGHAVFAGRATELERDCPFAALVGALDQHLVSLPHERLRALDRHELTELAAVFPALAGLAAERVTGLPEERYLAHHAVRSLLEQVAGDRPCVLALDDLQWADGATRELLAHLMRRRPRAPLLLVLASRPADVPPTFIERLVARSKQPADRRVVLPPPGRDEAAAARRALGAELEALGEPARTLLHGAAVTGDPFELGLAAEAADLPACDAPAALDELLERGLVQATGTPREFGFRRPIVRKAAYESAGEGWRRAAHGRAAAALGARGVSAPERAHQVERSARAGDLEAVALLEQAGHATAPLAPATAARRFESALRLVPEANADRRLGLLMSLAAALGSAGALEDSRVALGEAHHLLPPELAVLRGQAVASMAAVDRLQGRVEDARALLLDALDELPGDESEDVAALQIELAADRWYADDRESMSDWAERAWGLAGRLDQPALRAAADGILALAAHGLGHTAAARERADEACGLVDALADSDLAAHLDACLWLGWAELGLERCEGGTGHMRRGLTVARATGQGRLLVPMTIGLLSAEVCLGRLPAAATHAEQAFELARLSGAPPLLGWALAQTCLVAMRQGDLDKAIAWGEQAVAAFRDDGGAPGSPLVGAWLGEARVEAGIPECGREELLAAAGGAALPGVEPAMRPSLYDVLTRAELALGRVEEAQGWAERGTACAAGLELGGPTGFALRAGAEVALAREEPGRAAELALKAVAFQGCRRIEAGRSRIVAGRALAAAGDAARAGAELQRAVAELDACGAAGYSEQAAAELRRLGEPEPRR